MILRMFKRSIVYVLFMTDAPTSQDSHVTTASYSNGNGHSLQNGFDENAFAFEVGL